MSGWREVRLGDLVNITHGWPFVGELCSEEITDKPIIVSIGNFRYTGGFRFEETMIREYRGDYPKEFELTPNEILLVMTCQTAGGEILGIPARVPDDGRTYLHNQRMGKVVVKRPDMIDEGYLYWLFLWSEFNRELFLSATGTKILHTAPTRIEAFRFPCPPIFEQRTITSVLGALDDKIELNRRMNETLETMARALFQNWFVDACLRQGFGRQATQAGLPKGWEVRGLDEIANFLNGLALQKFPPEGEDSLPVIKIAQLRAGHTEGADRCGTNLQPQYIIEDGDVLFSWSGSLEVEIWCGGRGALNQHLFKVTSEHFPKWFYFLWTRYHLAGFQNTAANKATTMGHIQRHHLREAKVFVPPPALMETMNKQFAPLLDKFIANRLESRTLAALRDALLPKLLSGELRLPSRGFGETSRPAGVPTKPG